MKNPFCIILIFLLAFSGSTNGQPFIFLDKAKQHYHEEVSVSPAENMDKRLIDSLLRRPAVMKDFNQAYDLTWRIGLFLLQQGKYADALDIFNELHQYLAGIPEPAATDKKRLSSVLNVIGAIYEETGLWTEAMELYISSLQICMETGNDAGKAKVYNNIGKLYYSRQEWNKAEEMFNKAIAINTKLSVRPELFNNYNNIAGIYLQRNNPQKALQFALMALNQLDINKDLFDLSIVYMNIGNLYQKLGNFSIALSYYEQAASLEKEKSFHVNLLSTYQSISSLYETLHRMDSAAYYLELSLRLAGEIGVPSEEAAVYRTAADFYRKSGNVRLASEYYARYVDLNDSLNALNSVARIDQVQAVYEHINREKDNKILQQKLNLQQLTLERQRIFLVTGLIIFIFLTFSLVFLQRSRRRERRTNELISEQSLLLHQKEREMMQDKENVLTLELDYKNRQLTSHALNLARDNEFIAKTTAELKQILLGLNPRDKERADRIRKLLTDLHQYSSRNDWEEFRLFFEEVHQSFEKNLSTAFPLLTPNDKRICALLRLGLSTKDISSITFRELRSVESARNRLRKKLNLPAEVNLQTFLSQF